MKLVLVIFLLLLQRATLAQEDSLPLDALKTTNTILPLETVSDVAGLHVGAPINKAGIESACKRLSDSGLFGSIGYQYAPGPKTGYIVTLNLTDQTGRLAALIDIPGVDQEKIWQSLAPKYPGFVRKIPESAESFFAHEIEQLAASELHGQHVVARLETDLKTGKNLLVFGPEHLPQVTDLVFIGVSEFRSDELAAMIRKTMGTDGYSERQFKGFLEGVVRQAYEERGMYRMSFGKVVSQAVGQQGVAVTTEITEGPKFTLGDVELLGDNLPRDAILKAAALERGKIADWREIQQKIYATETPVKRTGYFEAVARPERVLRDEQHVLDLRLSFILGPLYHFGEVAFVGLPPSAEETARKTWKMETGSPYDLRYSSEFVGQLSKKVDLHGYKVSLNTVKTPAHVVSETLTFSPK